ncbi:hypothetical protein EST38_g8755 [Candolleomyces aberdarensis]|uniref:F-box domain-containing protein n=1 Tax=Candolleomyces aberdarensis TaxID=2316362 RepID=A0A4Q2DEZ4_9AGAR|nr:hypothetical protein EST38_g8755 [Candolleomyces aberdarensis]
MNELVEPLTFASITINFGLRAAPYIEHQMSTLASGNSPATRWAKKVAILNLVVDTMHQGVLEKVLACQNRYLIPAIQALQNVQFAWVSCGATPRRPDVDSEILQALSQIPTLRNLSLSFPEYYSGQGTLPLDTFNLRVLKLNLPSGSIRTPMIQSIGPMVARSPALEELTLVETHTNQHGETNLDIFFEDPMHPPSFVASLTKLTLVNRSFTMSALSVPRLRSLVHLDMGTGNVDASFWRALAGIGVKIRYFAVYPLDAAVILYLASYEGLKELHIRGHHRPEAKDCPEEVFHTVLPRHRQSLQQLTFSSLDYRSWSITDNYLECVLGCSALRSLALLYHYPEDNREWPSLQVVPQERLSMDLSALFTRITERLGRLETLKLSPRRQPPQRNYGPHQARSYLDIMDRTFTKEICEAAVTCAHIPAFQLYFVTHGFGSPLSSPMVFDLDSRRFKPVDAKEEGEP